MSEKIENFYLPFRPVIDLVDISIALSNNIPGAIEEVNFPPSPPKSTLSSRSLAALFGIRWIVIC